MNKSSLEAEAARLLGALQDDPQDRERWIDLGRWCARAGTPPPGARPADLGPSLLRFWRRRTGDRDLVPALLGLLDAELVHPDPAPGVYWSHCGRRRSAENHDYDGYSGLPLVIRRRRDGARMRLVPWGYVELGRDGGRRLPERRHPVGFLYLDEVPVGLSQLAAFRGLPATTGPLPALCEAREALAYAAAQRGELPLEGEWCRLRTRTEALRGEPRFSAPFLDGEERRELREEWRRKVAPLLEEECALSVAFAPVPEWTATPSAWFEAETQTSLGGEGERLVVRGAGHLEASPLAGKLHAFRVAYPLGVPGDVPPSSCPRSAQAHSLRCGGR